MTLYIYIQVVSRRAGLYEKVLNSSQSVAVILNWGWGGVEKKAAEPLTIEH